MGQSTAENLPTFEPSIKVKLMTEKIELLKLMVWTGCLKCGTDECDHMRRLDEIEEALKKLDVKTSVSG